MTYYYAYMGLLGAVLALWTVVAFLPESPPKREDPPSNGVRHGVEPPRKS